jgi:NADH:ubiquinone oxidoreductase subunit 6 (subunit J)
MLFLDLEFLALAFAMVYIGGIAVMFLFLILIIDVKIENTKNLIYTNSKFLLITIITIVCSFIVSYIYLIFFDPFIFNNVDFQEVLVKNLYIVSNSIYFDFDILNYYYICDFDFSDLFILGVYLFKSYSILLLLIAVFLFIATIVSILLCTSIFE